MEKTIRCTVCTWRGAWSDAEQAPRVPTSLLEEAEMRIQAAYEDRQAFGMRLGAPHEPPCPSCGHHTMVVKHKSIRPAM